MQALESALEINHRITHQITTSKIDEISIWLAALSDFVEMYGVEGCDSNENVYDFVNGLVVGPLQIFGLSILKKVLTRK